MELTWLKTLLFKLTVSWFLPPSCLSMALSTLAKVGESIKECNALVGLSGPSNWTNIFLFSQVHTRVSTSIYNKTKNTTSPNQRCLITEWNFISCGKILTWLTKTRTVRQSSDIFAFTRSLLWLRNISKIFVIIDYRFVKLFSTKNK